MWIGFVVAAQAPLLERFPHLVQTSTTAAGESPKGKSSSPGRGGRSSGPLLLLKMTGALSIKPSGDDMGAMAATTVKDRDGYEFEAEESVLSTLPAHHGVLPLLHVNTGATQPLQKFVKHVLPFNLHKCVLGGLAIVVKACATDGSELVFLFLLIGTWLCLAFVDRLCGPAVCQCRALLAAGSLSYLALVVP